MGRNLMRRLCSCGYNLEPRLYKGDVCWVCPNQWAAVEHQQACRRHGAPLFVAQLGGPILVCRHCLEPVCEACEEPQSLCTCQEECK